MIVPQQSAYVVERLGRFSRVLSPGLNILIPFIDKIAYVHSLKEEAIPVQNQTAITADNVTINIDGVLYLKIEDPVSNRASKNAAVHSFATMANVSLGERVYTHFIVLMYVTAACVSSRSGCRLVRCS